MSDLSLQQQTKKVCILKSMGTQIHMACNRKLTELLFALLKKA